MPNCGPNHAPKRVKLMNTRIRQRLPPPFREKNACIHACMEQGGEEVRKITELYHCPVSVQILFRFRRQAKGVNHGHEQIFHLIYARQVAQVKSTQRKARRCPSLLLSLLGDRDVDGRRCLGARMPGPRSWMVASRLAFRQAPPLLIVWTARGVVTGGSDLCSLLLQCPDLV